MSLTKKVFFLVLKRRMAIEIVVNRLRDRSHYSLIYKMAFCFLELQGTQQSLIESRMLP